jgi:tetratricopeptide (TPR) repeat protein
VSVAAVNRIDPTMIGVDAATPTPFSPGPVPTYIDRNIDTDLRAAVADGLHGRGQWLVVVLGPSKVGKSRTLFEALRVFDDLQLVAPVNGDALRALLSPGQDLRLGKKQVVLWLDDLEPFLNQGVTLQTLRQWHGGQVGRIVAATFGGKGSGHVHSTTGSGELDTIATHVIAQSSWFRLHATTVAELEGLRRSLSDTEIKAIVRHGLAAYLVAGLALEIKLTTAYYPTAERKCVLGAAVVQAAVDWVRCGRTDPLDEATARELCAAYVQNTAAVSDQEFHDALYWATSPVAGTISLLNSSNGYTAYDYVVRIRDTQQPPLDEAWAAALRNTTGAQALAVGVAAHQWGRWEDAIAAFTVAESESVNIASVSASLNLGVVLLKSGRTTDALAAYQRVFDRFGADSDPALRALAAWALVNRGAILEDPSASLAAYDALLTRYGDDTAPELRVHVAAALINKGSVLGRVGRLSEAMGAYDQVISRYIDDPTRIVREQVAKSMHNKGMLLAELGHTVDAVLVHTELIDHFAHDPNPELREQVVISLVSRGCELVELDREAEALADLDQVIAQQEYANTPTLRDFTARALLEKGVILATSKLQSKEALNVYDHLLSRYAADSDPALRLLCCQALANKAPLLATLGEFEKALTACSEVAKISGTEPSGLLAEQVVRTRLNEGLILAKTGNAAGAASVLERIVADYSTDPRSVLRKFAERSHAALEELREGNG